MANTSEMFQLQPSRLSARIGNNCLIDTLQQDKSDQVTILTLKMRLINQLASDLGLPLSYISHIQATCIPVHPEIAQELNRWAHKQDQVDAVLAQDFVPIEKLLKIVKSMCKNGHTNITHALLAMDGLSGKLSHVPNTECKRYVGNLKYGLTGEQGRYDREASDDMKRAHVNAVRKVYQELDKHRSNDAKLVDGVYQVMRLVLKESGGIELPDVEEKLWSEPALEEGVNVYKDNMKEEYFKRFVEMIKTKIASLGNSGASGDEEEGVPSKKQKTK